MGELADLGMSADAEINAKGVIVQHDACEKDVIAACHAEILKQLEHMLTLPKTMAESMRWTGRHFLPFSTLPGFTVTREPELRRDVLLPISSPVEAVLKATLSGNVGSILLNTVGRDAELCSFSAIISEPGAQAQAIHSDADWNETAPRIITMFLALHDILDEAMGPTRFCPATHTPQCFPGERWLPATGTNVADRSSIWFALNAGDAVLMDSTLWHCGGANTSERRRMLLSVSFAESRQPVQEEQPCGKLRLSDFMGGVH